MKVLAIFVCLVTAITAASANVRVGAGTRSHCDASQNVVVAVTRDGAVLRDVSVDVYREVENGERRAWSGITDKDGLAHPSMLEVGKYRVFVDTGDLNGTIDLAVSGESQNSARCKLDFVKDKEVEPIYPAGENSSVVELNRLRGVVEDPTSAVIPRSQVILQQQSGQQFRDIASTQTDSRGEFDFGQKQAGVYRILVVVPGFCRIATLVNLSNAGSNAMEMQLPIASDIPGYCAKEMKIVSRHK